MTIRLKPVLIAAAAIALGTAAASSQNRSTKDGVYTLEQAKRGAEVISRTCSRCHQTEFFKGQAVEAWVGNTVAGLYESIARTMPEDRPGSLKPQEYADILAYMFELNQYPPGKDELSGDTEALANIVIERRDK